MDERTTKMSFVHSTMRYVFTTGIHRQLSIYTIHNSCICKRTKNINGRDREREKARVKQTIMGNFS